MGARTGECSRLRAAVRSATVGEALRQASHFSVFRTSALADATAVAHRWLTGLPAGSHQVARSALYAHYQRSRPTGTHILSAKRFHPIAAAVLGPATKVHGGIYVYVGLGTIPGVTIPAKPTHRRLRAVSHHPPPGPTAP